MRDSGESDQLVWRGVQQQRRWCLCQYVCVLSLSDAWILKTVSLFVVLWDNTGVKVYFFNRNSIPTDITANAPIPERWGTPSAFWPASTCNPFQFFQDHSAIFDTTLCGDWAGSVWTSSGMPGQQQSCAQLTGVGTCTQYVQQNGAALSEACACFFSHSHRLNCFCILDLIELTCTT